MAWISPLEGESVDDFIERLDDAGSYRWISAETSGNIVASTSAGALRQRMSVQVWEYVGIDEDGASLLASESSDDTTQTTLYAKSGQSSTSQDAFTSATVTSGERTEVSCSRKDDTGQWVARFTNTTYSYSAPSGTWSTTVPSAATAGYSTSLSASIRRETCNYNGATIGTILLLVSTETKEYQFLTSAAAAGKQPSSNLVTNTVSFIDPTTSTVVNYEYVTGTTVSVERSFKSESAGWTVKETTTTTTRQTPSAGS